MFTLGNGNRWDRKIRVTLALTALFLAAAAAEAKEGLYLGAEIVFADIGGTVNAGGVLSAGNGAGLTGGYGISRNVAVEASFWSTGHDASDGGTIDLHAALLGVKAVFPLERSHIEPYVMLGIGRYGLDERRGEGWLCGAGMDIGLFPAMRLTIGIARHAFDLGTAPRESGEITSMSFGFSYHFK